VRFFIDLVVERLPDKADFVLSNEELPSAETNWMQSLNQ
jgi:hypothetical protein